MTYRLGRTAVGDQERARTDADDDDHDEEGVHDGDQRRGQREEDLLHLRSTDSTLRQSDAQSQHSCILPAMKKIYFTCAKRGDSTHKASST
jgi:hypothetical protein